MGVFDWLLNLVNKSAILGYLIIILWFVIWCKLYAKWIFVVGVETRGVSLWSFVDFLQLLEIWSFLHFVGGTKCAQLCPKTAYRRPAMVRGRNSVSSRGECTGFGERPREVHFQLFGKRGVLPLAACVNDNKKNVLDVVVTCDKSHSPHSCLALEALYILLVMCLYLFLPIKLLSLCSTTLSPHLSTLQKSYPMNQWTHNYSP